MPFGKDSYKSTEKLGYLNSQQALADFAVLIRSLKKNHSSEASPVVVFGGSYGGSKFRNSPLKYFFPLGIYGMFGLTFGWIFDSVLKSFVNGKFEFYRFFLYWEHLWTAVNAFVWYL